MPHHQKPKPELLIDEQRQRYVIRRDIRQSCEVIDWPAPRSPQHLRHMDAMMRRRGYLVHRLSDWQAARQPLKIRDAALVLALKPNTVLWRINRGHIPYLPGSGKGKGNPFFIPVSAVTLEELQS